jgi:PEP-CTERM motif
MRHPIPLLFLAVAAVCSATPVTFNNVSVTCVQTPGTPNTETLTVTVDPALNGGTITAGASATNKCYFNLVGNALAAPFTNGNYTYTSPQDSVCYFTGGLCLTGITPIHLNISPVAGGQLFAIDAVSIATTFILPGGGGGGGGGSPVPEPESLILLGSGLTVFGLVFRRRQLESQSAR